MHRPTHHKRLKLGLALATVALLAACGGGGDGAEVATPAEPPTTVPDSATASVEAYVAYTSALLAADQNAVPMLLNSAAAPVSESAVPVPVL